MSRATALLAPVLVLQFDEPYTLGQKIAAAGPFVWLAILVGGFLVVCGGMMIAQRPPRRAILLLGLLGLLPVMIGGIGMGLGYRSVRNVDQASAERGPPVAAMEREAGYRQAELALMVGAVASAPILALALVGLAFPRRRGATRNAESPDR